jgi:probable F420-dependent oxidoreductase
MNIGVYIFPTEYSIPIVELACHLEDRGIESLFVPEHTHIPASRRTPFPSGDPLPKEYSHTLDPFVALAAVASRTTKLRIGTGICLLIERDPIVTAKVVASLDHLSNGRFELGLGAGWIAEEMENHGTKFEDRFRVLVDRAKAMQKIWTEQEASYDGEFVQYDSIWSWPKPSQKPHPPLLLGGQTKHTLQRVVDFADGWLPHGSKLPDPSAGMEQLQYYADQSGRDMKSLSVTIFDGSSDKTYLEKCRAAGIARVLLPLPSEDSDTVLPILDQYAKLLPA